MRFHLIALTFEDVSIEVELTAQDAADAVNNLADLVQYGQTPVPARAAIKQVYARPISDNPDETPEA